ncbi:MAG: arylsulfatase [Verrucomicrobiota bacterium]
MPALPKLPILLTALILCASMIAAAEKPNLIYILLDDAGYGDLSCYGQTKFETPQIDRLASEGLKFTQHYSGSTVCAPTRCVLMTGKHTGHAHVRGNREIQPEGQAPMPADIVTLPRLLSEAGYRTGCFGKWGLGAPGSPSDPMEHFDAFFGYNCQREAHTYYPTHLWRDREKIPWDGKTHTHPPTMDAANEFIRESAEGPFFLFLAITIPHAAMHCPEEHVAPWRKEFPEFEGVIGKYGKHAEVDNPVAAFAGMMTLLDDTIGDLLNTLDAAGIDENTLVVFSSDNGPHKEGGHQPDLFDSNGPLRGYKRDLSEGGIRVPMLARWPGTIAPGRESEHISAHWDILPTFCELEGLSPLEMSMVSLSYRPCEGPTVR